MKKVLLDCGNCGRDFHALRQMVHACFNVTVIQTHGAEDTLKILRSRDVDLVTVNRKLDRDYSDGLDVARQIKADPKTAAVPVMLVSNYEEHQQRAVDAGCVRGFGKLALQDASTKHALDPYLGSGGIPGPNERS